MAHWAGGNELENGLLYILRAMTSNEYPRLRAEYEKLFPINTGPGRRVRLPLGAGGAGQLPRTLVSLYWQLEDQWAASTWESIDRAGRWKVLYYRARDP